MTLDSHDHDKLFKSKSSPRTWHDKDDPLFPRRMTKTQWYKFNCWRCLRHNQGDPSQNCPLEEAIRNFPSPPIPRELLDLIGTQLDINDVQGGYAREHLLSRCSQLIIETPDEDRRREEVNHVFFDSDKSDHVTKEPEV